MTETCSTHKTCLQQGLQWDQVRIKLKPRLAEMAQCLCQPGAALFVAVCRLAAVFAVTQVKQLQPFQGWHAQRLDFCTEGNRKDYWTP